jgi:plastocyanin
MDRRRRISAAAAAVAALAIAARMAVAPVLAADKSVSIAGFAFHPTTVTVNVGDTVTWTNSDGVGHTATSSGDFDTGTIPAGGSKSVTFGSAGTFSYICTIHSSMRGTVIVRAAGGGGTAPDTDAAPIDPSSDGDALTLVFAGLGIVMLVGTFVVDRLLRRRSGV